MLNSLFFINKLNGKGTFSRYSFYAPRIIVALMIIVSILGLILTFYYLRKGNRRNCLLSQTVFVNSMFLGNRIDSFFIIKKINVLFLISSTVITVAFNIVAFMTLKNFKKHMEE